MTNKRYGTLYTGSTHDLYARVIQHRSQIVEGFTKKYQLKSLVYFEALESFQGKLLREDQVKKYPRKWKFNLIASINPQWLDLTDKLVGEGLAWKKVGHSYVPQF